MQYEDIVNNLLNKINDSSNEEQCNSFKFLLMLIRHIHDNHGRRYVEIFYRDPHEDLEDIEERNDYDIILENENRKIITFINIEKYFFKNKIPKGFRHLLNLFENARLTSIGRGKEDDTYIFINKIKPIVEHIESIIYENNSFSNENIKHFVNNFYEKINPFDINICFNKFKKNLKENKKRKSESINDNNLYEKIQKLEESFSKEISSLKEEVKSSENRIESLKEEVKSSQKEIESLKEKDEKNQKNTNIIISLKEKVESLEEKIEFLEKENIDLQKNSLESKSIEFKFSDKNQDSKISISF